MPIRPLQRQPLVRGLCLAAFAAFVLQTTQVKAAHTELEKYKTAERIGQERLKKFDTLDFGIYTNRSGNGSKRTTTPTSTT